MLKKLKNSIADVLFPPFCVSCNAPGEWWCEACRSKVHKVREEICPKCLNVGEHACTEKLEFANVQAIGYYHNPKLREVITSIKFKGAYALESALYKFVAENQDLITRQAVDCIIPMPLSEKRIKDRGFNQSLIVARVIREICYDDKPLKKDLLVRVFNSNPQSSLSNDYELRSHNIKDSFFCDGKAPSRVLLVDDVVTTGATAGEAARVLRENGAKEVYLVCLAVGA